MRNTRAYFRNASDSAKIIYSGKVERLSVNPDLLQRLAGHLGWLSDRIPVARSVVPAWERRLGRMKGVRGRLAARAECGMPERPEGGAAQVEVGEAVLGLVGQARRVS
jgi:hypothetical protein